MLYPAELRAQCTAVVRTYARCVKKKIALNRTLQQYSSDYRVINDKKGGLGVKISFFLIYKKLKIFNNSIESYLLLWFNARNGEYSSVSQEYIPEQIKVRDIK